MTWDLLFRGATVHDGTGAPPFVGDLAVASGRIAALAPSLPEDQAGTVVEAAGRVLAPGFIDSHTHDDAAVLLDPDRACKVGQGVTTVVVGCCGLSLSPLKAGRELPEALRLLGPQEAFCHGRMRDYASAVDAARPSVNVAALVGHSTLRVQHMADLGRSASLEERTAMRASLERAVKEGATGLSTGVFYAPSRAADLEELAWVAAGLAPGMPITAHIRDEYDGVAEALEEALEVARLADRPLVVSHHKTAGPRNWGRTVDTLALLDRAAEHQTVHQDAYPYDAGSTVLDLDLVDGVIDILVTWSQPHPEQGGRRLADIAADWGLTQREAAERLLPGGAVYFQMREDDVRRVLAHPRTLIGSDGLPMDPRPHPRLHGAFPRFLAQYCGDGGLMDLAQGLHRMTGLPAQVYGLKDRGVLREGAVADLVLFDPATFRDQATYADSRRLPTGLEGVWVAGVRTLAEGAVVERAGRFLRR